MSSAGAGNLGAIRDSPKLAGEAVTKRELGKDLSDAGADSAASAMDILSTLAPTGVIALYTMLLSALVGLSSPGSRDRFWWAVGFHIGGILVALFLARVAYRQRTVESRMRSLPAEVVVSALAFAAWGAATPSSWVIELFEETDALGRTVTPLAIAGVSALVLGRYSAANFGTKRKSPGDSGKEMCKPKAAGDKGTDAADEQPKL